MPLLTKRSQNGFGVFWKMTPTHAMFAGILFGLGLGLFLSMALFSFVGDAPKSNIRNIHALLFEKRVLRL